LPSFLAIVATFGTLAFLCRRDFHGDARSADRIPELEANGWITIAGIVLTALALVIASAVDAPLGITTFVCGAIVFAIAGVRDRAVVADVGRSVSWSVLALVAGLFVLVQGVETTGLLRFTRDGLIAMAAWSPVLADLGAAFVTAVASNAINNLPAGLIAGSSVAALHGHDALRSAVAIGIDLGPNLSVTGSLATVLWLTALRREKIDVTAWTFLCVGMWVMPAALVLAVLGLAITTR
jgi:arsenical pump membrane protein